MQAIDYQLALYKLLPKGVIWPTQPGEFPEWDKLLSAMSHAPAAFEAAAAQALIEIFPDTTTDLISEWETLVGLPDIYSADNPTLAQRRAAVLSKLTYLGLININDLQAMLRTLSGQAGLLLKHRLAAPFASGASGAGDGCGSAYQAAWWCEYMTNVLGAAPDDFSAWSNRILHTNNVWGSPITGASTADYVLCQVTSGGFAGIYRDISGLPDNCTLHASVWARTFPDTGSRTCGLVVRAKDGTETVSSTTIRECWDRLEIRAPIKSGGTTPRLTIRGVAAENAEFFLTWAHAGVVDPIFESRARSFFPRNTQGIYGVIGEYSA